MKSRVNQVVRESGLFTATVAGQDRGTGGR